MRLSSIGYLTGVYALDVAMVAHLNVQSTSYPLGQSPEFPPTDMRWASEQVILDLSRLNWWDQWRVLWSRIGMHYMLDLQEVY